MVVGAVVGLSACGYDDTPMALKVIDGESSRLLYARILADAAARFGAGQQVATPADIESIESAYQESHRAYATILECADAGTCRWSSMASVCADVDALLQARETLAPVSGLLAISVTLSANQGPMSAERLRLLESEARKDGSINPFEEQVLTLARAATAASAVYGLTPAGAKEKARYRQTHAIDEFARKCAAERL